MAGNTSRYAPRLGAGGRQAPGRVALVSALFRLAGKTATSVKTGTRYAVRRDGDKLLLDVTRKGGSKRTLKPSDAEFLTVAPDAVAALNAGKASSSGGGTASSGTASTATTTDTASTSSTDTATAASAPTDDASAPAWTKKPYIAEVLALDGWSDKTYAVKAGTFDRRPAPTIVVTLVGRDVTTREVRPISEEWEVTAKAVLDAKLAADAAATVDTATSTAPASDTFAPSTESAPTSYTLAETFFNNAQRDPCETARCVSKPTQKPADATTVSDTTTPAPTSPGFVQQYEWWLVGGAAAAVGYVLLHRSKPETFPLPAALSKWVR